MRWEKNREPELFFAPVSTQHSSVSFWAICCMCMPVTTHPAPPHLVVPECHKVCYIKIQKANGTQQSRSLKKFFFFTFWCHRPRTAWWTAVSEALIKTGWSVHEQDAGVANSVRVWKSVRCITSSMLCSTEPKVPRLSAGLNLSLFVFLHCSPHHHSQ